MVEMMMMKVMMAMVVKAEEHDAAYKNKMCVYCIWQRILETMATPRRVDRQDRWRHSDNSG